MLIKRRTFLAATGAVAAATTMGPFVSKAKAADFSWKFGHGFPATHPLHVRALEAADRIKRETNGAIEIDVLPNSQLGGDSDLLAQVRSGAIDFFSTGGLILSTLVPVASINGMGFAFKDYDAVWPAMDGDLGGYIRRGFDKAGLHAFENIWDNGFRQITTRNKPITGPADLDNFKIRVPVSPVYVSLFKALGAAPTSINLGEVYTALQTGVVDGQENPLVIADTAKFHEVQKYCSLTNHVWDGSWIITNGRTWKSVPDDLRQIVSRGFNEAGLSQRKDIAGLNAALRASLTEKGLTFNQTDPEPFRAALRKSGFYAEWKAKYGDEAWGVFEKSVGSLT
ncbi:ABC transporter substrate-binding protein [Skermanella stibiiresistens SB22]|uniref:ABC transporter substrate-binding protein n=1 Tax=Skermanella stibiiresistens SB22 TaxID=1385369 RepID=W9H402_9PROT|nr:TRAP transporter substrate-binding protein [Skermanella stibiiresistens]EWY40930.1 ABC transporter substrate-binding protein [Skermanella stibiiresistens SB22]